MKSLLLFIFFSVTAIQIKAQCTESAGNFGNNTSVTRYNVSGDISVTLNTNNTITLQLGDNFRTAPGPDVRAYLVNSEGRSINQLKELNPNDLNNIAFGLISCTGCSPVIPANGAQTLTVAIPEGKDITDYDTVFFYCLAFNAFWDVGSYTSFASSNCSVLDVDTFSEDEITLYPNPANNYIQLSNVNAVSTEIRIFNVLGKQVFYQPKVTTNTIDISSFDKGIYLVKIVADGKSKTQKLIIK